MVVKFHLRDRPFVMIDRTGLLDNRLSWKAKGLLAYLMSKPEDWKILVQDLVNRSTDGEKSVRAGLDELRKYGYAKLRQERDDKKRLLGWVYDVFETPELNPDAEKRNVVDADFVDVQNVDVQNVDVENRYNSNIELLLRQNDTKIELKREDARPNEPSNLKSSLEASESDEVLTKGIGVTTSKPKSRKRELKTETLFRETEFVLLADGFDRFCKAMITRNEAYQLADLDYYYRTVLNWSDSKDARKKDWIATAANFILGDQRKGGFKKPETNSTHNGSSKDFNTVTERDLERAQRLAARFGW